MSVYQMLLAHGGAATQVALTTTPEAKEEVDYFWMILAMCSLALLLLTLVVFAYFVLRTRREAAEDRRAFRRAIEIVDEQRGQQATSTTPSAPVATATPQPPTATVTPTPPTASISINITSTPTQPVYEPEPQAEPPTGVEDGTIPPPPPPRTRRRVTPLVEAATLENCLQGAHDVHTGQNGRVAWISCRDCQHHSSFSRTEFHWRDYPQLRERIWARHIALRNSGAGTA